MSRIGRLPIHVPSGITVKVDENNLVTITGPKGTLSQSVNKIINVKFDNNTITVTRNNDLSESRSMHGLYRTLINNIVLGVKDGYKKSLIIKGVGYKATKQGNKIVMNIGFSHPVEVCEQEGITLSCPNTTEIVVEGISKEKVGAVAASIKALKPVEPYHGYGIRYSDEVVILKEGKTAGKK